MTNCNGAGPYICVSDSEPEPSVRVMHKNSYLRMNCNLWRSNFGKEFLLQKNPILQLISKC